MCIIYCYLLKIAHVLQYSMWAATLLLSTEDNMCATTLLLSTEDSMCATTILLSTEDSMCTQGWIFFQKKMFPQCYCALIKTFLKFSPVFYTHTLLSRLDLMALMATALWNDRGPNLMHSRIQIVIFLLIFVIFIFKIFKNSFLLFWNLPQKRDIFDIYGGKMEGYTPLLCYIIFTIYWR